jgi:CHASE2 domain-containing sensor protein
VSKLVILKLAGSFEQGFSATLQIGEESDAGTGFAFLPAAEIVGQLPLNPELLQSYQSWQSSYRRLGLRSRLNAPRVQVTNVSLRQDCEQAAEVMQQQLNIWLRSEPFRPVREKWLEQLKPQDRVRVVLQSENTFLQRLPWHLWDLLERYRQAEIALSLPTYERVTRAAITKDRLKILAILGNSQGIDVQTDRMLLEQLPDADVTLLVEPERQTLNQQLWVEAWDILFFAGHSLGNEDGSTGVIQINPTNSLTIPQLKYALKKAVERGLRLAIFNSCDGLGLARDLADLQLPQMIVMREPVPDRVAQVFLKAFLSSFSQGYSFYLAVRAAREQLQGIEDQFPCATWLPVICQNLAELPLTWQGLRGEFSRAASQFPTSPNVENDQHSDTPQSTARLQRWHSAPVRQAANLALCSLLTTLGLLGLRSTGLLQALELKSFDALMQLRPAEPPDNRLLIVTISAEERQKYGEAVNKVGWVSLSDRTLTQLLRQLAPARVIGLDLYRDFPVSQPALKQQYRQDGRIVSVCKTRFAGGDSIAPPPDLPPEQVGFSDFVTDADQGLRRQLLVMTPDLIDAQAACTAPYAFSTQLAARYLHTQGIALAATSQGDLQIGSKIFQRFQAPSGVYQQADSSGNQILLNYRATSSPARQVTLSNLLSGQVNPTVIQDRIVLVGVIAADSGDIWTTPISNQMPGVIAQSYMVSQLLSAVLNDRPLLRFQPLWIDAVWIGGWALIGSAISWHWRCWRVLPALLLAGSGLSGLSWLALIGGIWLPLVPAAIAILVGSSAIAIHQRLTART